MEDRFNGWVGFSALLVLLIGAMDFIMGLIAVIRSEYYAVTPNNIIIFDTTTWGWLTLLLGIAIILIGLALANGSGFARWVTIVVVSFNLLFNLSWLGNGSATLWALTVIALQIIVIYALTARWNSTSAA